MLNLLLLLVLTGSICAGEKDINSKCRDPKLLGGGGGENKSGTRKHRIPRTIALTPLSSHHGQQFVVPTNPPACSPNISIALNRNSIDIVDLRGRIEAQNIDIGDNRSWFERFMDFLSRLCGSRERRQPLTPTRPPSPPQLRRTDSVYPGRGDKELR
jgi:hypothetical protein